MREPEPIRIDLVFHGRVQGVGFRATTRLIARDHAVTGFVRNEPDGTVRCVAEGDHIEVGLFRAAIETRMARQIERTVATESPATDEFAEFTIAH